MLATPDQQLSQTDPDARAMATAGRGKAILGYNVQAAVDTTHDLIVAHEVTNVGSDRSQLANMARQAKEAIDCDEMTVVADRGHFNGDEVLECELAGITPYVPKTQTSNNQAKGLFGKRDFIYIAKDDEYECPAGERLTYRITRDEGSKTIHRYWTSSSGARQRRVSTNPGVILRLRFGASGPPQIFQHDKF